MTGRRRVEDDQIELVLVEVLENLREGLRLVDTRDAAHHLVEEAVALLLDLLIHTFHRLAVTAAHERTQARRLLLGRIDLEPVKVFEAFHE